MDKMIAIKSRLQYFYGEKITASAPLEFLLQDLVTISDKYPKVYESVWIGNNITDMYLMSNSTVRVIMLTKDKRLVIGKIHGDNVMVDKLECGITDDAIPLIESTAVIVL